MDIKNRTGDDVLLTYWITNPAKLLEITRRRLHLFFLFFYVSTSILLERSWQTFSVGYITPTFSSPFLPFSLFSSFYHGVCSGKSFVIRVKIRTRASLCGWQIWKNIACSFSHKLCQKIVLTLFNWIWTLPFCRLQVANDTRVCLLWTVKVCSKHPHPNPEARS